MKVLPVIQHVYTKQSHSIVYIQHTCAIPQPLANIASSLKFLAPQKISPRQKSLAPSQSKCKRDPPAMATARKPVGTELSEAAGSPGPLTFHQVSPVSRLQFYVRFGCMPFGTECFFDLRY